MSMKENELGKENLAVLRKVSRTLYFSIAVLPSPVRFMLGLGYLVCRAMDTVVDSCQEPAAFKKEILLSFRTAGSDSGKKLLEELKKISLLVQDPGEKELLSGFDSVLEKIKSMEKKEAALLQTLVKGVSEGMIMDLESFSNGRLAGFNSEKDLLKYCRLIGGVPGIYWFEVYNLYLGSMHSQESKNFAYQIGTALQIVNVLKDISCDFKNGRCYIPVDELSSSGLKPEELSDKKSIIRLRPVLGKWTLCAIDMLDSSERFLFDIKKENFKLRAAVIWPVYWAMDSLQEVAISNPLAKRSKINKRKIYSTIVRTPSMLFSNTVFQRGYRFRRETLIVSLNGGL